MGKDSLVSRGHALQALEGSLLEALALARMGYLDQLVGSLTHVLAPELSDSVFGDDVMDVAACCDDAGALEMKNLGRFYGRKK